jgi:hypothetical protein
VNDIPADNLSQPLPGDPQDAGASGLPDSPLHKPPPNPASRGEPDSSGQFKDHDELPENQDQPPLSGPCIQLPWGRFGNEAAAERIFRGFAASQSMFNQDGTAVEIVRSAAGEPALARVTPAAFCSRLEILGTVLGERTDNKGRRGLRPTQCSERIARSLLATRAARRLLPPITLVTKCDVATVDTQGNFKVLGAGYHPELGGIYVDGNRRVPEMSFEEARDSLGRLMQDFHFATESDESRAFAGMLTPALVRGGFLGPARAPLELVTAKHSQSGKTYFQQLIAAIYGESLRVITEQNKGVGSLDENFATALVSGRPFIQIDNMRGDLNSMYLEAFLTAESTISARVPHRAAVQVDARRFTIMMTSNGLNVTRDLFNRCSIVRIHKRPQNFEYHKYPENDLLSHVKAKQLYYLGCVYRIIRDWVEAGRPQSEEKRHEFRTWARSLDWIVKNLFKPTGPIPPYSGLFDDYSSILQDFGFKSNVSLLSIGKDDGDIF